jgi:hypothetical protein
MTIPYGVINMLVKLTMCLVQNKPTPLDLLYPEHTKAPQAIKLAPLVLPNLEKTLTTKSTSRRRRKMRGKEKQNLRQTSLRDWLKGVILLAVEGFIHQAGIRPSMVTGQALCTVYPVGNQPGAQKGRAHWSDQY